MFRTKITFALLPLLFSGCTATPERETGSETGPIDPWDFRGEQGNLSLRLQNVAWVHAAIAAPGSLQDEDLALRVRMDFSDAGRGPKALLVRDGQLEERRDGLPIQTETCSYPPQAAEDCADDLIIDRDVDAFVVNRLSELASQKGISRPVHHFFIAVFNAPKNFSVAVDANWNNTRLNLTYGLANDTSLHHLSDFERVDSLNRRLQIETTPGRYVGFDFLVRPVEMNVRYNQLTRGPSYTRPDGSVQTLREVSVTEFSPQSGMWLFNIPEENLDPTQDIPVLMRAEFVKATLGLE